MFFFIVLAPGNCGGVLTSQRRAMDGSHNVYSKVIDIISYKIIVVPALGDP